MSDHYNTDGNMTSNEVNQTFYKISNVGFTSKYFELFKLFLNLLRKNFKLIRSNMNREFGSKSVTCLDVIFMTGELELGIECSILNTDHAKVNSKSKSIKFASKTLLRAFCREISTLANIECMENDRNDLFKIIRLFFTRQKWLKLTLFQKY